MKRTVTAVATTLGAVGILLTTSLAHAQQQSELGQKGQFILSADRLVPFFAFSHESVNNQPVLNETKNVTTDSQTSLSFFYGYTADFRDLFYTVPRVGLDYTIVPNVTIGGDLVLFFTLGGSHGTESDSPNATVTTSTSAPSTTLFGIAPRGGYVLGLSSEFALWLRGGFSFYTASTKTTTPGNNNNGDITDTNSQHQWSLDVNPQLVFTPVPHIGFTAGVTLDIPLAGGRSEEFAQGGRTTTFSGGASVFYLGVTLGMLAHF